MGPVCQPTPEPIEPEAIRGQPVGPIEPAIVKGQRVGPVDTALVQPVRPICQPPPKPVEHEDFFVRGQPVELTLEPVNGQPSRDS